MIATTLPYEVRKAKADALGRRKTYLVERYERMSDAQLCAALANVRRNGCADAVEVIEWLLCGRIKRDCELDAKEAA